ncbi:hypothetical protein [Kitasatospora sp. NPDC088783]|uniref:hypothetical protein n=1 Tax=Kitasatospora sp. NPDC088783 TaxID=3364077 RepID=UPI000CC99BBD
MNSFARRLGQIIGAALTAGAVLSAVITLQGPHAPRTTAVDASVRISGDDLGWG